MFNKDEIEKLKIENESLRNQLEVKEKNNINIKIMNYLI